MPILGGPTLEEAQAMVKAATEEGARVRALKAVHLDGMKEKDLQAHIRRLAEQLGWAFYHTYRSDRSTPGYPDLTLVHDGQQRLIFAELKRERTKPTGAQVRWLDMLASVPGVEVYLWRPSHLGAVPWILKSRRYPTAPAGAWKPSRMETRDEHRESAKDA